MRKLSLQKLLDVTHGTVLKKSADAFSGIGTDTRTDLTGQLFIALKGESFDAHDFVDQAAIRGAAAILIDHETPALSKIGSSVTVVKVTETLKALQALGTAARREGRAIVIGLTGSNGKTTTKEFIAQILSPFRNVHFSKGSFNNHWGVPFTLLQLDPEKEIAVVEMGMNHAGEITDLVRIAEPDIVMCTMVGRAHIEYFGTVDAIAAAKEEIYEAAKPEATRIYNLENEWTRKMHAKASHRFPKAKVLTFSSENSKADVHLKITELTMRDLEVEGHFQGHAGKIRVPVFGAQNLTNLMAAGAAALAAGLKPAEVWQGLAHCRTAWGRNQFVNLKSGAEMIFDAYNANPDSMRALLENMKLLKNEGRKIGVFGQMRELGNQSPELHQEIGEKAGASGFNEIYFIGEDASAFAAGVKKAGFAGDLKTDRDYSDGLGRSLAQNLRSGDVVVVKGSRGTKLERFVIPCEPLDFGNKE